MESYYYYTSSVIYIIFSYNYIMGRTQHGRARDNGRRIHQITHYGIMGGLAPQRNASVSTLRGFREGHAKLQQKIPPGAVRGLAYMMGQNPMGKYMLSSNPQCAGGVGRMALVSSRGAYTTPTRGKVMNPRELFLGVEPSCSTPIPTGCDPSTRKSQCVGGDKGCGTIDGVNNKEGTVFCTTEKNVGKIVAGKDYTLQENVARGSWCGWWAKNASYPFGCGACLEISAADGFKVNGITPEPMYMVACDSNADGVHGGPLLANQFSDIWLDNAGTKLIENFGNGCMKNGNDPKMANNAVKWKVLDSTDARTHCYKSKDATDGTSGVPYYQQN